MLIFSGKLTEVKGKTSTQDTWDNIKLCKITGLSNYNSFGFGQDQRDVKNAFRDLPSE